MRDKIPHDSVNSPSHYTAHPTGIQAIDIIEHMPHNIACAVGYLWRLDLKSSEQPDQDIDKAIWHLQREKKRRETFGIGRKRDGALGVAIEKITKPITRAELPERKYPSNESIEANLKRHGDS